MANEKRPVRVTFLLTEEEMADMARRQEQLGIRNMSAYIRKMVLNGYILHLDIPEMQEILSLMRYTSNNINQLAKFANSTGKIYENDLKEIQTQQKKLWDLLNKILIQLGKIQR